MCTLQKNVATACKPSAGIVEFLPYFYIPKTVSPFVLRFWMLISRYVVLFVFL